MNNLTLMDVNAQYHITSNFILIIIPTPDGIPLRLRIGINLGKVVVGILGVEIPRLCVIGNTVNVANRLQTTTDPDTIQISTYVYEVAKERLADLYFEEGKMYF